MQRTLLGFGIGAVGIAIFGFVVLGLFGMDSSQTWGTFRFPHGSAEAPMGSAREMGPGMMGNFWSGSNDSRPAPPAFEDAVDVTVTLDDFAFSPADLTVTAGQVNLTLTNTGAAVHDLTIPDLGISVQASPGETVTTGLDFTTPGTYETLCSIPGHASLGMTGTLVVLPSA